MFEVSHIERSQIRLSLYLPETANLQLVSRDIVFGFIYRPPGSPLGYLLKTY